MTVRVDGVEVEWAPDDVAELPSPPPRVLTRLDVLVQDLVDHDEQTKAREFDRWEKIRALMSEVSRMGHYVNPEGDPLRFRCGDVLVTIPHDRAFRYEVVSRLPERNGGEE